jgi:1-acyl-sn-glycerol-3-phosphate acyltransferase
MRSGEPKIGQRANRVDEGQGPSLGIPPSGHLYWRIAWPLFLAAGKVLWHLRIEREAPVPEPPFVLAANHFSHLDPPLIGTAMHQPVAYMALEELAAANRFLAWTTRTFGTIAVQRERRSVAAVRAALAVLRAGGAVGVFPEGRRAPHWGAVAPKRGAGWLALRSNVPLVPVAVIGTDRVLGMDNKLRSGSITVVAGEAIDTSGLEGLPDPATELTRRWVGWVDLQMRRFGRGGTPADFGN